MAAITVTDAAVPCPAGVTTVAASKVTRVGGNVQNQSRTTPVTVRLGADPTAVLGHLLKPGASVNIGALVDARGNDTDNLQSDVRVFNPSTRGLTCYVVQGEIP